MSRFILMALFAAPASGQLYPNPDKPPPFEIMSGGQTVGTLVVIPCDASNVPAGYTAGYEYWSWESGQDWPTSFRLVPTNDAYPAYSSLSWEIFPHEHFDTTSTVDMPSVTVGAGDRFYHVEEKVLGLWIDHGYMHLDVSSAGTFQDWYARHLNGNVVGTGTREMRFTSVTPPTPGSEQVYLLE